MAYKCKTKKAEYARKHYEQNKDAYKKRARTWTKRQYDYLKKLTDRYKLYVGCKVCAYRKCAKALEFHHRVSEGKDNHIAEMIHDGISTKRIKAEIRKCVVVCANCHREIHAEFADSCSKEKTDPNKESVSSNKNA